MPLLHGIRGFGGVVAVEANDRLGVIGQLGVAVEDDELVSDVFGVVTRRGGLIVFDTERETFFGQQTTDEVEIRFPVLGGDAVGAQRLGDLIRPDGFGVVGEDLADDVDDGLILEQIAVPTLGQEGEEGFHDHAVAGKAAIGTELHGLRDIAVPGALAAVSLQQALGDFFTDQGFEIDMGVGGDAVDVEAEGLGDCFTIGKALDDQRCIRQGGLQFQQPGVLVEESGEKRLDLDVPIRAG